MSGSYGLFTEGLIIPRRPEIRNQIVQQLQDKTGLVFDTATDNVFGRIIDVYVDREVAIWETVQAVYLAKYPDSAQGISMDRVAGFAGIRRRPARRSQVQATIFATQGTVAAGLTVRSSETSVNYILQDDVVVSLLATNHCFFTVSGGPAGTVYTLNINNVAYGFTASSEITGEAAAAQLAANLASNFNIVATATGVNLEIRSTDYLSYMRIVKSANIFVGNRVGSVGTFFAEDSGEIQVSANTVNQIVTAVPGVSSVNNHVAGEVGAPEETTEQLRARYNQGTFQFGTATIDNITANLIENVPNINYLRVYSNRSNATDADGRPAHSVEVVVSGGADQRVAEEIFRTIDASTGTFGSTSRTVKDISGENWTVNFNRPSPVFVWAKVEVTLYDEEIFPANGMDLIKQIIADTGNSLSIGEDVIRQRLIGPIMSQVKGIEQLTITLATSANPLVAPSSGAYNAGPIDISVRGKASLATNRVEVAVL